MQGQMQWYMTSLLVCERQKQEDTCLFRLSGLHIGFQAIQGYTERQCLKHKSPVLHKLKIITNTQAKKKNLRQKKNTLEGPKNKITLNLYALQQNLFKLESWKGPVKWRLCQGTQAHSQKSCRDKEDNRHRVWGKLPKILYFFIK